MKSLREHIGADAVEHLHRALDDMLDSSCGWIIIADLARQRITDSYLNVCDACVMHTGGHITANAVQVGVLLEEGVAKLHGHKHAVPPLPHQPNPKASK